MFYKGFLVCTLGLILLSCTNRLEVVSIDEIEIIRTSRDSTYFKDGSLFTGQIIITTGGNCVEKLLTKNQTFWELMSELN